MQGNNTSKMMQLMFSTPHLTALAAPCEPNLQLSHLSSFTPYKITFFL